MVPFITPSAGPSFGFDKAETRVLISGSGNVAQFAALKVIELGATVLSLSDSKGALISCDGKGFTKEDILAIAELKLRQGVLSEAAREGLQWHAGEWIPEVVISVRFVSNVYSRLGKRPWLLVKQADIALPSATQNEVSGEEAKGLVAAGVRIVAEGSNMVRLRNPLHRQRE